MIRAAFKAYVRSYRRHHAFLVATLAITSIFTAVNSVSMVSDYARVGQHIAWGKPLLYEVSSAIAILVMLPFLIRTGEAWPPTRTTWLSLLPRYAAASLLFSAGHVFIMVAIRKALFPMFFDGTYEFLSGGYGAIPYEYWKDARTFVLLLGGFFVLRDALLGRAARARLQPVELRSGATRILLDPADFLYAKAAANYAEIVTTQGDSLARITLAELEEKLAAAGLQVARIHRSYIVNKAMIRKIDPIAGGDLLLTLKGGQALRASRRYKDGLQQQAD